MLWKSSVPGKTFLFGEYSVLAGGPAAVLACAPGFTLAVTESQGHDSREAFPFHPESPSGRLYERYKGALESYQFRFTNHFGVGGFGASSAEFVLLAQFISARLNQEILPPLYTEHFEKTLGVYFDHELPENRSSGSDVLLQWMGQSLLIERKQQRCSLLKWSWTGMGYSLFATGLKVKTHEHLNELGSKDYPSLLAISQVLVEVLRQGDQKLLFRGIADWEQESRKLGLRAPEVIPFVDEFARLPNCAAKACGALGADVILVIHPLNLSGEVEALGVRLGLQLKSIGPGMGKGLNG